MRFRGDEVGVVGDVMDLDCVDWWTDQTMSDKIRSTYTGQVHVKVSPVARSLECK